MSFNGEGEQPVHPTPEGGITPQGAPYGEVTHYGEVQTPSSSSKKWIGAAAAVAVVVALTVGGVVAVNALSGGGAQPEDVLPANAIAFSKLDLDPSAGQKVAAFRLISKFPKAKDKVTSEDTSIKESIFGSIFTGKDSLGLDYKKDVEPWLGDRIGVGVFPDIDGDKNPEIGVAIAVTDRDAAKVALDKAIANTTKKQAEFKVPNKTPGQVPGYAFAEDDYMIVSDTAAHASALVDAGKVNSLAKSKYAEDVKRLGSDQIAVAWVDLAATYAAVSEAMPKDLKAGLTPSPLKGLYDPSKASGRFVIGLHADPSFLEVTGKAIDFKGFDSSVMPDAGTGSGLIESFPSDVFGAATITGLGKAAGAFYTAGAGDPRVKSKLQELGIDSAQDIETLLGAETGVVVGGTAEEPEFAVRTRGSDADAALAVANKVIAAAQGYAPALIAPGRITASKTTGPDGIVVGMGSGLTAAMSDKSGSKLGGTEAFRLVAPDAGKAVGTEYVNLSKIISMLAKDNPEGAAVLEPLSALGMTATGGAEPTVRIRLSFK